LEVASSFSNAATGVVVTGNWVDGKTLTATNPVAGKPTSFMATATLVDGTNVLYAIATDSGTNTTVSAKPLNIFYIADPETLTVITNGSGKITPYAHDLSYKMFGTPIKSAKLAAGHNYQVTAAPVGRDTNKVAVTFVQWDLNDNSGPLPPVLTPTLTFTMTPGLTISARFSNHH